MARGDHIYVRRPMGYTHHGIEMGDGTVVHFTGEPLRRRGAKVRRTAMTVFAAGRRVRRHEQHADASRREEIVERALSKVGDGGYRLVTNNCEHFATWCLTGSKQSKQIRRAATVSLALALAASAELVRRRTVRIPGR